MGDLVQRFSENPLITPESLRPSRPELMVESVMNPGVFTYKGRVGMVLQVSERPPQEKGWVSFAALDEDVEGGMRIFRIPVKDRNLGRKDWRITTYAGDTFSTTLSHLRLAWSDDGRKFRVDDTAMLTGQSLLEMCGIEDCRVAYIDGLYVLTYSAISPLGGGVGMAVTADWKSFVRHGMIMPPANQNAVLFDRKIGGDYVVLHRPSGVDLGGAYIWQARSRDLVHWGRHACVLRPRKGRWDNHKVGACCSPILTKRGWLLFYHGMDHEHRQNIGAVLLGREDPSLVLARSDEPLMIARDLCEMIGVRGNVLSVGGHITQGDAVTLYYSAAETVVCAAEVSISDVLLTLVA